MGRRAGPPQIEDKRGALYYVFTFRPAGAPRGERVCIPAGTSSRKEASRRMSAAVADWKGKHPDGKRAPSTPPTVGEREFGRVWGLWVDGYRCKGDRKPSDAYRDILKKHGLSLAVSFPTVDDISTLGVEQHKRNRRAEETRETTLYHELASLKVFARWLEKKKIIAAASDFELPTRDDRESECLSPEEVHALLAKIPERVKKGPGSRQLCRTFFEVLFYQGLRDRTVAHLAWDDYNDDTGELHIRASIDKNRYERSFQVFDETKAVLDRIRPDIVPRGAFIFGPMKRWKPIKKAAEEAGLGGRRISEHTLRHSRTTELCSRPDADPAAVAYLLGWRDVATLYARYFHPSRRHADRFVAAVNAGATLPEQARRPGPDRK